jgi:hypothetical protein
MIIGAGFVGGTGTWTMPMPTNLPAVSTPASGGGGNTPSSTPASGGGGGTSPSGTPNLIFCLRTTILSLKPYTVDVQYQWFADNGVATCANPPALEGSVALSNAERSESGTAFPFENIRMGDLTNVYAVFYDCAFVTGFNGDSSDSAAYDNAAAGAKVGVIGCNSIPTTVTTWDGAYGFCYKRHDQVDVPNQPVITQTLFYCVMSSPRGK